MRLRGEANSSPFFLQFLIVVLVKIKKPPLSLFCRSSQIGSLFSIWKQTTLTNFSIVFTVSFVVVVIVDFSFSCAEFSAAGM